MNKCNQQQPGNGNCKNCLIKKALSIDSWKLVYIVENDAINLRLPIETRPGNAWVSMPDSKKVICGRGKEIPVC